MRQLRHLLSHSGNCRDIQWTRLKILHRCLSTSLTNSCKEDNDTSAQKYKNTVLLPSTSFPLRVEGAKRVKNERKIQEEAGFADLYDWQRKQSRKQEYVLHDGPPYANGKPHIGHAVNKILKDVTMRQKLLKGYKVHYVPGWDCHGLPIELKALDRDKKRKKKEVPTPTTPLGIRKMAKKFAEEALDIQRETFKRWGVMANWSNIYRTFDPSYISKELLLFADLYEKGYVYQAYKPVYFSPSSGTALAEAELEYNNEHCSPSIYVGMPCSNLPHFIQEKLCDYEGLQTYLAVWTTTPWTLPANEAVCFSPDKNYSLVLIKREGKLTALIWAEELLDELKKVAGNDITILCSFEGCQLAEVKYRHPLAERLCPCLPGSHVTMSKGTGLVHTAPAHGHDDFLIALDFKIPVDCKVDARGCYTPEMGLDLAGKRVLEEGNDTVTQMLVKPDGFGGPTVLLAKDSFVHSYPYDWRTKKPVIIRASKQWFINTDILKEKALEMLQDVTILPRSVQTGMIGQLERRPYWCISRQRVWGAPIPVFYDKVTGDPVVDRRIIEHVADVLQQEGPDSWWTLPEENLLPPELVESHRKNETPLPTKGTDIFDIWFDSGSSWNSVLGGPSADLYLEGVDQFTGWFQSSLLTSVASTGKAPYKQLYVHGFTLDETGRKMSKSLNNVIDPDIVTDGGKNLNKDPVYGADVLRWWVASHATNHTNLTVGKNILDQCKESVQKVRAVLRFLLASLGDYQPCEHSLAVADLKPMDQYMLHLLKGHIERVWEHYENFEYHRVTATSLAFINSTVSALYFSVIKDRLYCESRLSSKRMSALLVLHNLLHHLLLSLAPILPHLAEEVTLHHHNKKSWHVFHQVYNGLPASWDQPELTSRIERCLEVRDELYRRHPNVNCVTLQVTITAGGDMLEALRLLQRQKESVDSGLCELLLVSRVILLPDEEGRDGFSLEASKSSGGKCLRCRKYTADAGEELCARCRSTVSSSW
ncbi:isoleucine--tRNA ligase, mitochondrial-like [Penaeus japonicus]|uniref:isoleucine--tRNA ligase, mitochondrial-like n=1 Tax=Penaeus japonicus TaxID=27405 RepID=UPI001C70F717|nr:isoleucine--tRNA ligase, mitochondrial-like [Penaeus japonicus]